MNDEAYMRMALEEAKRGRGAVNPNPLVGAVIVLGGEVLSTGYHTRYGELHAERQALANLEGKSCEGATMYVTLEPCCPQGKQPPCTDAIIAHKLARVVIGSRDPNPLVAGKGARILREAGIEVSEDVLRAECDAVNHVFMHYITTHRPYVMMKTAMTLDGKIACHTGASRWVTGEAARAYVQEMRNHYKGIMVGVGTVLADNPRLTCRLEGGRNPVRIVCDSHLRTPLASNVVVTANEVPTILATTESDSAKHAPYLEKGCEVLLCKEADGRVDLNDLMDKLGQKGIDGILLEGGGGLNESALRAGIVQGVASFIAPKLFGGASAKTPVEGVGVPSPDEAYSLAIKNVRFVGEDLLIESEVR